MAGSFEVAGFVLAGGRSTRMGTDKALLPWNESTLVEAALEKLRAVCVEVAIAGGVPDLGSYGQLIADTANGCGPLGGIVSALGQTKHDWNLFLAVDIPFVPVSVLRGLLADASPDIICVMAQTAGQPQPLCALYSRRAFPVLRDEFVAGHWKVTAAIQAAGEVRYHQVADEAVFRNLNTPDDFARARGERPEAPATLERFR